MSLQSCAIAIADEVDELCPSSHGLEEAVPHLVVLHGHCSGKDQVTVNTATDLHRKVIKVTASITVSF